MMRVLALLSLSSAALLAQTFPVTVNRGSGGGSFAANTLIHVWADPAGRDAVFDRWTGDIALLVNPNEAHTQLRVPNRASAVTATFKTSAAWQTTSAPINGISFIFYVPPRPVGMIFRFHGAGAGAAGFFDDAENIAFNRDAVAAGFGIGALDSANRTDRTWSRARTLANPDIVNVQAALAALKTRGLITDSTPLFAQGNSNGTTFTPILADLLKWRAVANFIAAGTGAVSVESGVPTMWAIGVNDDNEGAGPEAVANAQDLFEQLRGKGVATWVHINPATPVYPQRFARIAGFTPADSDALYQAFKRGGLLDDRDFQRENPRTSGWERLVPQNYRQFNNNIEAQLKACHATHTFFSDVNHKALSFLLGAIGGAPVVSTVSSPSFRTRVAPGSIASVFGTELSAATGSSAGPPESTVAGVRASVLDAAGVERPAGLYFASPGQINLVLPDGIAAGLATLLIDRPQGRVIDALRVAKSAPGLYSASANGSGPAAINVLRVRGGQQIAEPGNQPVDLGPATDQVFLLLFGTGFRGAATVTARIGGVDCQVQFAGPQGQFAGLDQINVVLNRSLAGRGQVDIVLTADGVAANTVQVNIR